MELDVLVQQLQRKLLENEQKISEINSRKEGLLKTGKEEQEKVVELTATVQSKVVAAGEVLKDKTKKEFDKMEKMLSSRKQEIVTDNSLLSQELEKITRLVKTGETYKFDMEECCRTIKDVLSKNNNEVCTKMPKMYPSKTLAKIKSSDLGYLCMEEYFPKEFQLVLTSSMYNIEASDKSKVICNVTTSKKFTAEVQANIKFSIKNKMFKDPVLYCKEECKLSKDEKTFQICFLAQNPGVYLVTVLLYDQQIVDSPLTLLVSEKKLDKDKLEDQLEESTVEGVTSITSRKELQLQDSEVTGIGSTSVCSQALMASKKEDIPRIVLLY